MRAATAAVVLVFCALIVIAIAHFREQSKTVVAQNSDRTNVTSNENQTNVAASGSTLETNANRMTAPTPPKEEVVSTVHQRTLKQVRRPGIGAQQLAKVRRNQFGLRGNGNPVETVAEKESESDYLPFTAPRHEEKLPSLADLVDEPE
jgi:hypothetical protein